MTTSSDPSIPLAWRIQRLYQQISRLDGIEVTDHVLSLFTELLDLVSNRRHNHEAQAALADPYLLAIRSGIRRQFACAAFCYERYWTKRLLDAVDSRHTLIQEYPYYGHYQRATSLEWQALAAHAERPIRRILMVGSGPLPLTSILLGERDLHVDNLDISGEANQLASALCMELGVQSSMGFITEDILSYQFTQSYDAVWLAALAGDDRVKQRVLAQLYKHMSPGSLLLARTSCGLRTLIYPSVTLDDLSAFEPRIFIQTFKDNLHSMYIVQR